MRMYSILPRTTIPTAVASFPQPLPRTNVWPHVRPFGGPCLGPTEPAALYCVCGHPFPRPAPLIGPVRGGEAPQAASTALVLIEFQNEFTTEGGKLHGAVKEVMESNAGAALGSKGDREPRKKQSAFYFPSVFPCPTTGLAE